MRACLAALRRSRRLVGRQRSHSSWCSPSTSCSRFAPLLCSQVISRSRCGSPHGRWCMEPTPTGTLNRVSAIRVRAARLARRASVRPCGADLDGPFSRRGCGDPRRPPCPGLALLRALAPECGCAVDRGTGNATVVVGLLLALTLRYRDSIGGPLALAAGVAAKLFVVPLSSGLRSPAVCGAHCCGRCRNVAGPRELGGTRLSRRLALPGAAPRQQRAVLRRHAANPGPGPAGRRLVRSRDGDRPVRGGRAHLCRVACPSGRHRRIRADPCGRNRRVPDPWVGNATLLVVPLAARTQRFTSAWLLLLGFGYLHWWHSPLFFRSAGLSVATIALTAGLTYFACAPARRTSPEESAAAIRTASPSGSPGEGPAGRSRKTRLRQGARAEVQDWRLR